MAKTAGATSPTYRFTNNQKLVRVPAGVNDLVCGALVAIEPLLALYEGKAIKPADIEATPALQHFVTEDLRDNGAAARLLEALAEVGYAFLETV